jgi:3-oxoacyl-[acyl-carrier protein] reductase
MREKDRNLKQPKILSFQDIKLGDKASFTVEISEEYVDKFADLSGDHNPIHMDAAFSKQRGFPGRLAHGMLAGSFFSRLVGMYLPGRDSLYLSQSLEFLKPIKVGDVLKIEGTIIEKSDSLKTLAISTVIYNQDREKVISGTAKVLITEQIKKNKVSRGGDMSLDLSGKVAIVTGSSRGIGAITALTLSKRKAAVVINYFQNRNAAQKVLDSIRNSGGQAIVVKADVSKRDEVDAMVKEAVKVFGTIDILINNATLPIKPRSFGELQWEDVQSHIDVLIRGAFNSCQAVLPLMVEKQKGKIVNVITTYAVGTPPAGLAHYVIAKSGLLGLSRVLAVEYGPKGINVNMVSPGIANTDLTSHISERTKKVIAMQTPLRRITEPEDVANLIAFLVSDAADFICGSNNLVCGGQLMI